MIICYKSKRQLLLVFTPGSNFVWPSVIIEFLLRTIGQTKGSAQDTDAVEQSLYSNTMQSKEERFTQTIEAHKGLLYKVANSYCKEAEERKDLLQEIVVQLWLAFDRYDPQFKITTWMYRIALNVAISHYRKTRKRKDIAQALVPEIMGFTEQPTPETDSRVKLLQHFISELRPLDRALVLLFLEDNPYSEIALTLGLSETNVATKLSRIKQQLKKRFENINT